MHASNESFENRQTGRSFLRQPMVPVRARRSHFWLAFRSRRSLLVRVAPAGPMDVAVCRIFATRSFRDAPSDDAHPKAGFLALRRPCRSPRACSFGAFAAEGTNKRRAGIRCAQSTRHCAATVVLNTTSAFHEATRPHATTEQSPPTAPSGSAETPGLAERGRPRLKPRWQRSPL